MTKENKEHSPNDNGDTEVNIHRPFGRQVFGARLNFSGREVISAISGGDRDISGIDDMLENILTQDIKDLFNSTISDIDDEINMDKLTVEDLIQHPRPNIETSESKFYHPSGYRGIVYYSKLGNAVLIEHNNRVVYKGPRAFEDMFPNTGNIDFEILEWLTLYNRFESLVNTIEKEQDKIRNK